MAVLKKRILRITNITTRLAVISIKKAKAKQAIWDKTYGTETEETLTLTLSTSSKKYFVTVI